MISQSNNEELTGKIEDIVSEKINQLDIITRDVVESVVEEVIGESGGGGGTSDTAKKIVADNGSVLEFDSNNAGCLNIKSSDTRAEIIALDKNNAELFSIIASKDEEQEDFSINALEIGVLTYRYDKITQERKIGIPTQKLYIFGNGEINGDLTVHGKIINNFDIKVKYQIVGDPTIFDTENTLNNIVVDEVEFYEITDNSLFPDEYKSSNLQYPYKYRIHKDSSTGDYYILLRIDKDNKYSYDSINCSVSSNFDKTMTTEIRPCDTPLLAVNGVKMTSLYELYKEFSCLETIVFGNDFDTSNITNMSNMFNHCAGLTTLDLTNFDTSNCTNMSNMFAYCAGLTTLNLSHFDTSKVENMEGMFALCAGLTTLDVSNFDTSKCTTMISMFTECANLTTLDVFNFDTSKCTDISHMFENCTSLTTLNLSNFNTSNVEYMVRVFKCCSALTTLDLSNFDMSNVEIMLEMFAACANLTTITFPKSSHFKPTDIRGMFSNCYALKTIYFYNFDSSAATDKSSAFIDCDALQTVVMTTDYVDENLSLFPSYLNTRIPDSPSFGLTTLSRSSSHTITHLTNIPENAEIGTFCETNGGIFDGYIKTASTDCICKVIQSNTLNNKIVGIICDKNKFASHGDVLVKIVPGTYNLGDILCPDITGKARVATETEKQFMMINAIPRPKITAFTDDQSLVACFIV